MSGFYFANTGISQFKSFGTWSKHTENDPTSIGIDLCRVGTAPGIFGLASPGFRGEEGPNSVIFGRILQISPGSFSSAEGLGDGEGLLLPGVLPEVSDLAEIHVAAVWQAFYI